MDCSLPGIFLARTLGWVAISYFRIGLTGWQRMCCCSVTKSCLTLYDPIDCSTLGFPVLHYLLEFAQTHVHWVGDAIQPSHLRVFSKESALCIRWLRNWSFSSSIGPSNEYSGLISFRIDWFDLLAVLGTLENLLQHHSSKASVPQCSAFFMIQLSHPYMDYWKNHSFD